MAVLFLLTSIFALIRRCLHTYVVGPIIFPAQNIARKVPVVFGNMLKSLGTDPSLVGEQGIIELRTRRKLLLAAYPRASNVRIQTSDGVLIDCLHFLADGNDDSSPTCIYFNANMQLMEGTSSHSTAAMYLSAGINLVLFNYRGVCESTGRLTRAGTIIDGDAVFQYVNTFCGVPENSCLLHARSIGGGIASQVAALHPGVVICSDRSFSSLLHVIRLSVRKLCKADQGVSVAMKPASRPDESSEADRDNESLVEEGQESQDSQGGQESAGASCLPKLSFLKGKCVYKVRQCVACSLTALAWAIDWDIPASDAWAKVRGRKWLFYHPEDLMIPLESSLYAAVQAMQPKDHSECYRMRGVENAHNRAFSIPEKAWHMARARLALGLEADQGLSSEVESGNFDGDRISLKSSKWTEIDRDESPRSPLEQATPRSPANDDDVDDDTGNLLAKQKQDV